MTTLPVLPLTEQILLPGMVIPVTLDSATQAAVDAARASGDKTLLAVPRLDGDYGPVGTIATIEQVGRLSSGEPAAVIRGVARARIGSGVPGPGAALWVEAERLAPSTETGKTKDLAREYKALVIAVLQKREAWQVIDAVERMTDLEELANSAGYAPWLTLDAEGAVARDGRPDRALRAAGRMGQGPPGRAGGHREDLRGCPRGHREDAARVPAPAAARRDPQGTRRGRAGRCRRLPHPGRAGRAAGEGPGGGDARGRAAWSAAATSRPSPDWIRTWLDTVLEMPWSDAHRGQHRPEGSPRGARRRSRRPVRREGPDPGVPGGA